MTTCLLENCGYFPGDIEHLLSASCPALGPALKKSLCVSLLSLEEHPDLHSLVTTAYSMGSSVWCSFLIDPTTFQSVIEYRQQFGYSSIFPVLKLSRTYIWCMHKTRQRLRETKI